MVSSISLFNLHKRNFSINTQKLFPIQALLYSLTFEKTTLLEKSTFQHQANVSEFELCSVPEAIHRLTAM
jgi:hypothetical protein